MRSLILCAFSAVSAAADPSPLACQPNSEQPMLPIFHIIGNVTQSAPGQPIKLEPINDCSGVTYYEGIYHIWHQCCQNHWDHVITKDLIHFQRLPPPIQPLSYKTWDGSISMLPSEDGGPIILYDAQDGKLGSWSSRNLSAPFDRPILGVARLADPKDKYLNVWTRDENNPVVFDGNAAAFPGQIWKNGKYWNMIMQGDRYQSDDSSFHKWTNKGPMIGKGEHGGQWWIPVPKQADGTPAPAEVGNFLVNINGGATYEFGHYDPSTETFTPSVNVTTAKLEGGQGGWWGAQQANDRMMMIGWALGDFHGDAGPGVNFLTRLTLLREVHFDKKTNNLVSNPVPELAGLRNGTLASEKGVKLTANATYLVPGTDGGSASSADVNIEFSGLGSDDVFGVCVLSNLGISITIKTVNNQRVAAIAHGPCNLLQVSAPRVANAPVQRFMNETDMPGNDYSVKHHDASFGAEGCQKACDADAKCVAWTWVVRGQGSDQGAGDCCLKDYQSCPDKNSKCTSGAKKASSNAPCGHKPGPPPGPRPGGPEIPLFDETSLTVRVTPDRSVADFFVQGGRWSGTVAWLDKAPRASTASAVSVWSKASTLTADIDVFSMGCGWAYPSYTDKPTM